MLLDKNMQPMLMNERKVNQLQEGRVRMVDILSISGLKKTPTKINVLPLENRVHYINSKLLALESGTAKHYKRSCMFAECSNAFTLGIDFQFFNEGLSVESWCKQIDANHLSLQHLPVCFHLNTDIISLCLTSSTKLDVFVHFCLYVI